MSVTRRFDFQRFAAAGSLVLALAVALAAQNITLPNQKDTVHFAVIGDSGTGDSNQFRVAQQLTAARPKFNYDLVLMLGDNLYGGSGTVDYVNKFEKPYKALLDAGVKFYAALGNHDNSNQRLYKPFNMNGERFYTFKPGNASVRFFALDSNYMDKEQLTWLEKELANSQSDWKIMFFHHPMYSSGGRHGSDVQLRELLEPIFLKYGVDVVLAGHDHFYERIKPQKGILHFVSGGAAKLRSGDVRRGPMTDKAFDTGYHFILAEVTKDAFHFQVISDRGQTVDSGTYMRRAQPAPAAPVGTAGKP